MFAAAARYATSNWKTVLFCTAIFTAIGIQAFRQLPIEAYPDVTDPMVEVVTVFPGQSSEEVERRVTLEIERVLASTPGVRNLRSVSIFGLSLVTLRFDENTVDRHNRAYVAERLREAELPDGVEAMLGPQATPVGQIYRYTLHGPYSLRELRSMQDWVVERRLTSVPGVAEVVTFGGYERQYAIRIDPVRLANLGVSVGDVYEAIEASNRNAGGGYVGIGSQEFIVRGLGTISDPAELGGALIREEDGVPIRVRDVADLVESSTPRRGSVGRGHDNEVVTGIVLLRRGENPSEVLERVHERVRELEGGVLPSDVRIETFYDRQDLIDQTIRTVGGNLLEGAILVVLIVLIFLRSWQAAVIVGATIPLALLAAFVGLRSMGMSANLISLGAIDFGILVENAAVVLEVTLHSLAVMQLTSKRPLTGEERRQTIIGAAVSVSRPVGFATLIIIAGLIPLFLLERVEGRIFAPMAYTYVFALIGARIAATTVVPALMSVMIKGKVPHGEAKWFEWLQRGYAVVIVRARKVRYAVLGVALVAMVAVGFYASRIGTEFLPELNEGGLYITSVFPSTIALDETQEHIPAIRDRLLALPESREVLSHLGRPEDATQIEGPNIAEFFVTLAPMSEWRRGYDRPMLEAELRESLAEIPGVQFNFSQPITDRVFETISGIIGQVVVKVQGEDLTEMTAIAEAYEERLRGIEGVEDLSIYQAGDVPSLTIELDRERLASRGLRVDEVQDVVEIALGGKVATEVWQGERRYGVALRLPESIRRSPDELGRLVVGGDERRVRLAEVATIEAGRGRSAIWRENLSRFVALKFNVHGRDLGSTVRAARAATADIEVGEGMVVNWGGEFENQQRAMARLGVVVPLTVLAMIFILYLNFKRWKPTFLIILLLPLATVCSVAFLRITGENFSVSAAVGCITLLGQITLGGVLMCSRIDMMKREGDPDPVLSGATVALRPILLTVCLAAFGLIPAALSHDMGSESQRPFARALIGGLFTGLPIVLLILPILYRPPDDFPEGTIEGEVPMGSEKHSMVANAKGAITMALILLLAFGGALLVPHLAVAQDEGEAEVPSAAEAARQALPADAPAGFSESDLLRRWVADGREVASIRTEIGAARFDIVQAAVLPNPELAIGGSGVLSGEPPDGYFNIGADLIWELPIFGQVGAREEAATRALRQVEMQVATALWERVAEIRAAAIDRAFTHARVQMLERNYQEIVEVQRIIDARAAAGVDTRYDALRVRVQSETILADLGDARADLAQADGELLALVAIPGLQAAPITPEGLFRFTLPSDPRRLVQLATERRPDLASARRGIRAQQALAEQFRVEAIPSPALMLGGFFTFNQESSNLMFGLSFPLPIFDRNQGSIGRALAEADGFRASSEAIALRIGHEVVSSLRRRDLARDALERFRAEGLGLADELVERAQRAYRGGAFSVVEVLDAHEAAWDARAQSLELERELASAEARLAQVTAAREVRPDP